MNINFKKMNRLAGLVSLMLALLLAVMPVFAAKIAYAAEPDPSWLEPVTIEIEGWTAGEPIDYTEDLSIKVGFKVPVEGDEVDDYFNFNDTVTLHLSQYFSFSDETTLELTANNGKVIGHVTLKNDTQGRAIAEIVFDESPEVFEIDDVVYRNVFAGFNATLTFNEDGWEDADEDSDEWYLDKEVIFILPGDTITETISKEGQLNEEGSGIIWEITITRMDDARPPQHQSLAGFTFRDELDGVGAFKSGSFSVKHSGSTEVSVDDGDVLTSENGKQVLVYEIPAGFESPLTITFETDLPSGVLVNGGDIKNTGQLSEGDKDPIQDDDTVTIDPPEISKEGWVSGEYDDEDEEIYLNGSRRITWYVEVDSKGLTLYELEIKDAIDSDLEIESISWEIWTLSSDDPPVGSWVASTAPQHQWTGAPTDNIYEIGDFNGRGRLTIVVKVPAPDKGDISLVEKTYTNTATVTWKGKGGQGTGSSSPDAEVGVGYNVITKKRGGGSTYPPYDAIPWEISVNLKGQGGQEYADDLTVYDLIIHDSSTTAQQIFDATDENGDPITAWPADFTVSGIGSGGIPRNDGQKFEGLLAQDSHLNIDTFDLYYLYDGDDDATHIGTLIKVTELRYSEANNFSFKTKIVDPEKLWGNDLTKTEAKNWVSLYKGKNQASSASATTRFNIRILDKDMLKREEVGNDHDEIASINPNNRTTSAGAAFHYGHKEIIFRLNINGAGIDFTDPDLVLQNGFGAVTVADKLPIGWVFVPFSDGSHFLIYEANPGTSYLTATGTPLSPTSIPGGITYTHSVDVDVNTDEAQETATFQFGGLQKPYVILVKAAPSEGKLEELLGQNTTITETNTARIFTENQSFKGFDEKQQFDIDGSILKKTVKMPSKPGGVAIWTVDYTPLGLEFGIGFLDTLPEGLDLRTDSSGQIDWGTEAEPNITISELQLKEDGSGTYEVVANSTLWGQDLVEGDLVHYSPDDRELTIYFPDPEKSYRVTYRTDITGVLGYLTNKVQLLEGLVDGVEDESGVRVDDSSGWAIMDLAGFIMIRKTGSDGKTNLPGAVFTLFNTGSEGLATTVRAVRTTGPDGMVRFLGLPAGTYILRETGQPAGYKENTLDYQVVVGPAPTFSVTINGQTGPFNANSPFIVKNYLEDERIGKLSVEKKVAGTIGDPNELFTFELTFKDAQGQTLAGSFYYIGSGVPDGTIASGGQVQLKHGQSITVIGLPEGTDYWVTELEANLNGYVTAPEGESGTIDNEKTSEAVFTNTRNDGSLNLLKLVTGNAGEKDRAFTFTVRFYWNGVEDENTYDYVGNGVPDGTITSGDEIQLAHGQSITIKGVPEGTWYEVEEDEADEDGYITTAEREEGVIQIEGPQTVVFTNSKTLGELSIAKTVEGNAGDPGAKFTFTVNLLVEPEITITSIFRPFGNNGDNGAVYAYVGFGGVPDGTISSGGKVELAHGQWIVIKGLPLDSTYEVIEDDADQDGYITGSVGETGGFTLEDFRQYARFVNTRNLGELTIRKIVNGISGDKTRKFTFEVTLTDAEGKEVKGRFAYKGTGVGDGEIASGGTVKLADGESVVIKGLPIGSTYKVVELEADEDDYITTAVGDTGTFKVDDFEKTAQFTNTNNSALEGDETEKDIPKTGDDISYTWLAVFVTSLVLLIALKSADSYLRRKRSTR